MSRYGEVVGFGGCNRRLEHELYRRFGGQRRAADSAGRLSLFSSKLFTASNVYTFFLYAALGGSLYFLPFTLIDVQGYTPTAAGPVPFVFDYFVQTFSFPGRNARFTTNKHSIGPEYFTASFTNEPSVASTIVGVCGDARNAFYSPPEPEIYVPAAQSLSFGRYLIRMHGPSAGLAASVSRALRGIEPLIPPPVVTSYDELLSRNADQSRAATVLFGALGVIALFLAIAGVFAVTKLFGRTTNARVWYSKGGRRAIGRSVATRAALCGDAKLHRDRPRAPWCDRLDTLAQ